MIAHYAETNTPENFSPSSANDTGHPHKALVSIIIPTFNHARFLPEAIDSALAQTYRPIEVLIIDDGSSDQTQELVEKKFGDQTEIRYIYQENQGLSAARNTGIREAKADWLVFLDADDRLLPQFIVKTLEAHARLPETCAIVAGLVILIDAEGNTIPDRIHFPITEKEISTIDFLVMNRIPCHVMAKRIAFDTCGEFDTELKSSEDRDMWIRISSKYRIFRLGEKLSQVRRHDGNMSGNGPRQARFIRQVLLKAYKADIIQSGLRIYWLKILSYFLYQRAILEAKNGLFIMILRILTSMILWPYHSDWEELGKKRPLFRIRMIVWLIRQRILNS